MSFLLWQRESDLAIASARRVLRADEVPQLLQALQLRDELDALRRDQAARVEAACAAAHAEGLARGLEQGRRDAGDELAAAITSLRSEERRVGKECRL